MTNYTTRRALFAATAGLATLAVGATVASPSEDDQFLAWEREADRLWEMSGRSGIGDDATDRLVDEHDVFQRLILETESTSLTVARVKASTLERIARDDLQGHDAPMAEIVAALRAAGAR